MHPDLSKVFKCLECDYKSKQKEPLNRHIQKKHQKDFGIDNEYLYKNSTKATSTANKSISPLKLEHETLQPNNSQNKDFQLNSNSSSDTPKKMQHEIEPVIIRFVSRERRLSQGRNLSIAKNNKESKHETDESKSESSIRSEYCFGENSATQKKDVELESSVYDVTQNSDQESVSSFSSQSSYLFRSMRPKKASSQDDSPKKRVRWSDWNVVMEDGKRKNVRLNYPETSHNIGELSEQHVKQGLNQTNNSFHTTINVERKNDEYDKLTRGCWLLQGVKCKDCDFKTTEKSLLKVHELEHTLKQDSRKSTEQRCISKSSHSVNTGEEITRNNNAGDCFQCIKRQYLKRQYQEDALDVDKTDNNNKDAKNLSKRRRHSSHRSSSIQDINNSAVLLNYRNKSSPNKSLKEISQSKNVDVTLNQEDNSSSIFQKNCNLNIEAKNVLNLKEELKDDINSLSSFSLREDITGNFKGAFIKDPELYHKRTPILAKDISEYSTSHPLGFNANRNNKRLENWVAAQQQRFHQFEENLRNQNMILKQLFTRKNTNHRLKNCSINLKRFDKL